jgi:Tol biopolymer transport system component
MSIQRVGRVAIRNAPAGSPTGREVVSPCAMFGALSLALLLALSLSVGKAFGDAPLVQIISPPNETKLRESQSATAVIRVEAGESPLASWRLSLQVDGTETLLAEGSEPVQSTAVSEIAAAAVSPGGRAELLLQAADEHGEAATAEVVLRRPAPRYALIPLDPGNLSGNLFGLFSVDDAGLLIARGGEPASKMQARVTSVATGETRALPLELTSSEAPKLSPDGTRFFYLGSFKLPGVDAFQQAIGYYDLISDERKRAVWMRSQFFTTNRTGSRIAFHAIVGPAESTPIRQFFVHDVTTDITRQLTDDPRAVELPGPHTNFFGSMPMISGEGDSIVFFSDATLGLAPDDPTLGAHLFAYDVAGQQMRYVTSLANSLRVDVPVLSRDGRWLSFTTTEPGRPPFPALLDVSSGEVTQPLLEGVRDFASFDSVVSPDGRKVVISTRADLDPSVGNADHNMELFVYDRLTGEVTQVAETVGGINSRPGGCGSYRPKVSADAGLIVFAQARASEETCHIDAPQRHEIDGFYLRFVRAVLIRPGNQPPLFTVPEHFRLLPGNTLDLTFTASDPDGDRITFFAQERGGTDVPPGSVIEDHLDGTATFRWPTRLEHAGTHHLRVAAFDEGGGEVFHDLQIDVVPKPACPGDCNGDGVVTVAELLTGVRIALASSALAACPDADADVSGTVSVDDLIAAVGSALADCR